MSLHLCSDEVEQEPGNGKKQLTRRQQETLETSVTPSSTKSSEGQAFNEDGLSERQKRRKRVGWALHQRRTGKQPGKAGAKKEQQTAAKYTRELEVQLCSQIREAQRLRQVFGDMSGSSEQPAERKWAQAAGLKSAKALKEALRAGSAAEKRLISEHMGFLVSLVKKFAHQVRTHYDMLLYAVP